MLSDFPSRVRQERTRLGLTQQQAADRLGIAQQTYGQLEGRTDDPRLSTLIRLAAAGFSLRVLAPELFGAAKTPASRPD